MTVSIDKMPEFGFGNKLIYYFNLRQHAWVNNLNFYCCEFDGLDLFEGNMTGQKSDQNYESFPLVLGEKFFCEKFLDSRSLFVLKDKVSLPLCNCAVHFRGTDFHTWNRDSILSPSYYLSALEEIMEKVDCFYLFTDDEGLASYQEVKDFLQGRNKEYRTGENTSDRKRFASDFITMSNCDYMISSPSTFCISAGFIGKKKRIIHSKKWILSRVQKCDPFWVGLYEGGNENYKLWKTF
jgi:hypothetical protein